MIHRDLIRVVRHRKLVLISFGIVQALVLAVGRSCLWVALFSDRLPEEKKWTMGVLGSIVGAGVASLSGRPKKSGDD